MGKENSRDLTKKLSFAPSVSSSYIVFLSFFISVDIFEPEVLTPTCLEGSRKCHSNARCIDFPEGFCCECVPPFYGNGIQCVENGDVSIFSIIPVILSLPSASVKKWLTALISQFRTDLINFYNSFTFKLCISLLKIIAWPLVGIYHPHIFQSCHRQEV